MSVMTDSRDEVVCDRCCSEADRIKFPNLSSVKPLEPDHPQLDPLVTRNPQTTSSLKQTPPSYLRGPTKRTSYTIHNSIAQIYSSHLTTNPSPYKALTSFLQNATALSSSPLFLSLCSVNLGSLPSRLSFSFSLDLILSNSFSA